jgi:hypothetical protein
MSDVPVASNLVISPSQPDIGVDDITGVYDIDIADDCGEDVSTYAYITSKGGGGVLQSGTIEVSGFIPPYTPIPSDNQADIHVELTPVTSCGQVGQVIASNTVVPANNPMEEVVKKTKK